MKKLILKSLLIVAALISQAESAYTPEYVGIYQGKDLNNRPCTVEVETFGMSTYRRGDLHRDVTVNFEDVRFQDLYFEAITEGKGTMKQNSLFPISDSEDKATWSYSHFAPSAMFRRENGYFVHVLKSSAQIDLTTGKSLVLNAQGEMFVCGNLQKQ